MHFGHHDMVTASEAYRMWGMCKTGNGEEIVSAAQV